MKKNITRVDALNTAINMITNTIDLNGSGDPDEAKLTETVEVLTSIRDTIAKANSRKSDKPTKTQVENAALRVKVLALMDNTTPRTVSEVMALDPNGIGALNNQKVSALLNSAVATGEVVKTVEKRKSYFRLA
jgi:hypothetical protein